MKSYIEYVVNKKPEDFVTETMLFLVERCHDSDYYKVFIDLLEIAESALFSTQKSIPGGRFLSRILKKMKLLW